MGDDFLTQDAIDKMLSEVEGGGGGGTGGGFGDLGDLGLGDLAPAAPAGGGAPTATMAAAPREIHGYDFSRASKFTELQRKTLQMIHESFARLFSSTLSAKIRTHIPIKVVSVEETQFRDYISTVSDPSIIGVFSMSPLESNGVIDISPQIGFPMMDRLLGGSGAEEAEARKLTDIEMNLMDSIIIDALNFMKDAWANVVNFSPRLEALESNPHFIEIVSPDEMVVLINMQAELGEKTGRMSIVLPYVMLEPVMPKLNLQSWFTSHRRSAAPESRAKVEDRLLHTVVPYVVQLGVTQIPLKDFLKMDVGDILQINRRVSDDLDVYVNDKLKFRGKPGVVGKRISLQITEIVKDKDEA